MPKGTCQAEAMSNSEQIKHVALAVKPVIELRLSERIRQAGRQAGRLAGRKAASQSVENSMKFIGSI